MTDMLLLLVTGFALLNCLDAECQDSSNTGGLLYPERDPLWKAYMREFNKKALYWFTKGEECKRYAIFSENLEFIQKHNKEEKMGLHTYTMKVNEWTDKTLQEIKEMYLGGLDNTWVKELKNGPLQVLEPEEDAPKGVPVGLDARQHNCNLLPEDQQPCGSCYIFAALAAVECQKQYRREWYSRIERLSVQDIIDCMPRKDTRGCHGGGVDEIFDYLAKNSSIPFPTSECYKYKATDIRSDIGVKPTERCRANKNCAIETRDGLHSPVKSYVNFNQCEYTEDAEGEWQRDCSKESPYVELEVMKLIYERGAGTASMAVVPETFRHYGGGIYSDERCSKAGINHAVAVFGYGGTGSNRYWLAKNSFGTSWGDWGFFKISRTNKINCNFEKIMSFPKM